MNIKWIYALMAIVGLIVPYTQLITWIAENGFDVSYLCEQAIANRISIFAWLDAIITVLVIIAMTLHEGRKLKLKGMWLPIVGSLTVGASFGLPLFLLMKEWQRQKQGK